MTRAISTETKAGLVTPGATDDRSRAQFQRRWLYRLRRCLWLYLLLLPTIATMLVFGYYPKLDVVIKSAYRWTPGTVEEYIGARNYFAAFADPIFWQSFRVVMIMLVANLVKMWPGIIVAIALHRLRSDRLRYVYQVCFVIPMVVPQIVWLLVWKSFYDPDFGILNRMLNATGAMQVLAWMDGTAADPGVMPMIASVLRPFIQAVVTPVFGSVWALILLGAVVLTLAGKPREGHRRFVGHGFIVALALLTPWLGAFALQSGAAAILALMGLIALLGGLAYSVGKGWIIWPFLILFGIWGCWGSLWRLPVLLIVGLLTAQIIHATCSRLWAPVVLRWIGGSLATLGTLLVLLGMIWVQPTNQFVGGSPAWLGNRDLILPSLILWGFPWVGTVGVLIYLAGLQQISTDVYEAAQLDGVGPVGKLFQIELPLIMTQVRINLILMTIGTLTAYEFFLILLGQDGGPGNVGMVPGLYMYRSAFVDLRYGYACAMGMVLFVIILLLTVIYQKYVKVEK